LSYRSGGEWFYEFPQQFIEKIRYSTNNPSAYYIDNFSHLVGEDGLALMPYVCSLNTYIPKDSFSAQNIDPSIMHFLMDRHPEFLDDGNFKSDYAMTSNYSFAEYKALSRYAIQPKFQINDRAWNQAIDMMSTCYVDMANSSVIDLDVAIQLVDKTTSTGWPWCVLHQTKGSLFKDHAFLAYYFKFEKKMMSGEPVVCIWKDFIKKEIRKLSKILAHDPRSVLSGPSELLLYANRLFAHQNEKLCILGASGKVPIWIGATKYYGGWHDLSLRLRRFPHRYDGDVSHWDAHMVDRFFSVIKQLRKSSLREDEKYSVAVDSYYNQVINSLILCTQGDCIMKSSGQPSGQRNTLEDNGLFHNHVWFYIWCLVVVPTSTEFKPTWFSFRQNIELVVMGDDVIYSLSEKVNSILTVPIVSRVYTLLGFTYKPGSLVARELTELEFCSTNFVKYFDFYVPSLNFNKMLASFVLKNDGKHLRMILLRTLSLRIECYFNIRMRDLLEEFIEFLLSNYRDVLESTCMRTEKDPYTFDEVMTIRKGPRQIIAMYLYARQ